MAHAATDVPKPEKSATITKVSDVPVSSHLNPQYIDAEKLRDDQVLSHATPLLEVDRYKKGYFPRNSETNRLFPS